jgi:hypothetical protein
VSDLLDFFRNFFFSGIVLFNNSLLYYFFCFILGTMKFTIILKMKNLSYKLFAYILLTTVISLPFLSIQSGFSARSTVSNRVEPDNVAKNVKILNTGNVEEVNDYLTGVSKDSTIIISLTDIHGAANSKAGQRYSEILFTVKYIKETLGYENIIIVINGDLAPKIFRLPVTGPRSLQFAIENFLFPLRKKCKVVFNIGNHDVQTLEEFVSLKLNLKEKDIPLLSHIPDGWYNNFEDMFEEILAPSDSTEQQSLLKQAGDSANFTYFSKLKEFKRSENAKYFLPYIIIGNTLFFSYCTSFLIYGGGNGCPVLLSEYAEALIKLHTGRWSCDLFPDRVEDNLITRTVRANFVQALNELAAIPGPINIVITAHEFFDPRDKHRDRVGGFFEFILKYVYIYPDVLDRISLHIVGGHDHETYLHTDAKIQLGFGSIKCTAFGTGIWGSTFAMFALKPQARRPVALDPQPKCLVFGNGVFLSKLLRVADQAARKRQLTESLCKLNLEKNNEGESFLGEVDEFQVGYLQAIMSFFLEGLGINIPILTMFEDQLDIKKACYYRP